MNNQVTITISGPTGSGKSAIAGEIEILCKSLGLPVEWDSGGSEKNLTGADWVGTLEMYKPSIRIVELASRDEAPATPQAGDDFSGCKPPMRHIPGVNVELLRRASLTQPTTVQQAAPVDPAGKPLNDAGWAFVNALPEGAHLNGRLWNNLKPTLKVAIEAYLASLKTAQTAALPGGNGEGE